MKLPIPAYLRVLHHLESHGRKTSLELQRELNIARRTVYAAVQRLLSHRYIREQPNFRDMRSCFYVPVVSAHE